MGKEIERKFLLKKNVGIWLPEGDNPIKIKQGYIHADNGKQVRVRLSHSFFDGESANICIKLGRGIVRDEFEFEIGIDEANELYDKCCWKIEKLRTSFQILGIHYDIDVYPNDMVWVEVEFGSKKEMKRWKKPNWIGKEITGKDKYSNIRLSKQCLKF